MEASALRSLVELSEARACASLVGGAATARLGLGFRVESFGSAVALIAPSVTSSLNMNRVIGLGIDEVAEDSVLDRIEGLYAALGLSYAIEIAPGAQPLDLAERLRRRRLRRTVATSVHFRAAEPIHHVAAGVSVVRADLAQSDLVADICCTVFRMPMAARAAIAATRHSGEWRQWLVYLGCQPIAAALSYLHNGVAWLGWDATLPDYRGHGVHAALIARRVSDAAESGCRYVTTETALHSSSRPDPSRRNYEKLGFVLAYERSTYVAIRAAGPRALSPA